MKQFARRLLLLAAPFALSMALVAPAPVAAASGFQWASCQSGSRSFAAHLYWNSSGYLYKMDFRSSSVAVKQVTLRELTSLEPMWTSTENFLNFAASSSYASRTVRSGQPWGWHRHWSGSNVLYQAALTVYANDGNWNPECTIQFYEQSDRF